MRSLPASLGPVFNKHLVSHPGFDGTERPEGLTTIAGLARIYAAMLDGCAKGPTFAEASRILELDASTSTLVVMVHFMISHYVLGRPGDRHQQRRQQR